MINFQPISNVIGILMAMIGFFMLSAIPISLYYDNGVAGGIFEAAFVTIIAGILIWKIKLNNEATKLNKREGYLIVALSWIVMGLFAGLPYYTTGFIPNYADCVFESCSGITTTGASILSDIEYLPEALLYWRSLTQWVGGMGIIVLSVAMLPLLGIGGVELFTAEAPGPTADKIHPRIKETAKRLWALYFGITLVLALILWAEGMTLFDGINHSLTCMATLTV